MNAIASYHHVRPEYSTTTNTYRMINEKRSGDFLATEEELAASQYVLSEVEALLLHLYDKKQLLLDRIGKLNDAISLKRNRQHASNFGVSSFNSSSHAQRGRINSRTWSEVVSGRPSYLYIDRPSTNINNNIHDLENNSCKRPPKRLIPSRNPMDHKDTALYPLPTSGPRLVNHKNLVNNVKSKKVRKSGSESPPNKAHKVIIIGDSHIRNCAANVKFGMSNVKSNIKDNIAILGVVKPGALTSALVNSAQQDLNGLSKKDLVVFCGGSNDISINNSTQALHHIKEFLVNSTHTNIALVTAPPRHDLLRSSYENSAVSAFNSKLKELTKLTNMLLC